jgi:RecG-like helicase
MGDSNRHALASLHDLRGNVGRAIPLVLWQILLAIMPHRAFSNRQRRISKLKIIHYMHYTSKRFRNSFRYERLQQSTPT